MKKNIFLLTSATVFSLAMSNATALVIDTNVGATPETTLSAAVLASGSGISIVGGTQTYQGNANFPQSGTYSDFNLPPNSGSTPTLVLPDGIFLTSGHADLPLINNTNNFSNPIGAVTESGANAQLTALSGTNTNDANIIEFDFTAAAGFTSVSASFVFGTDEFPTQSVTDIYGFFVDGINYAEFSSGDLIANNNATNFINNPVGGNLYNIEYNGLSPVLTVVGLLDMNLATHHISFGVADTSDSIWDSGVFITSLKAGTATDGGINPVPEPASMALLGVGLAAFGWSRRKRV